MNWQKDLKRMKLESIRAASPAFFEASGGFKMKVKPYSDTKTNGLTKAIIDYINFSGGHAIRVNTQGQVRKEKIQLAFGNIREVMRYTPSTTAKGTADIKATIQGRSVNIEVKLGKDKVSDDQVKQRAKEEAAGGLYFIAKDMPGFIDWYNQTFKLYQ